MKYQGGILTHIHNFEVLFNSSTITKKEPGDLYRFLGIIQKVTQFI